MAKLPLGDTAYGAAVVLPADPAAAFRLADSDSFRFGMIIFLAVLLCLSVLCGCVVRWV